MALKNYRDLSIHSGVKAGFQFEFACTLCQRAWQSPFRPYKVGRLAGVVGLASHYIDRFRGSSHYTDLAGSTLSEGAWKSAFDKANEAAERLYHRCSACGAEACDDCWVSSRELCSRCAGTGTSSGSAPPATTASASSLRCTQCGGQHGGGRFCAHCGFDFASTHKSCPQCGAVCDRSSRYCTDCGHAF